jgi:hypothetical protein
MPYTMFEDFAGGLDLRKSAITTKPGSLRELTNASINAGGEIEKRKTFTSMGGLPAGTSGLAFLDGNAIVFGTVASVAGLPNYVAYRQLTVSDSTTISRVLDAKGFASKMYVICRMSDSTIRHFYDGTEILARRGQGVEAQPYKTKMYTGTGKNLVFSAINAPADTSGTGSGLIDITAQDVGSTNIAAIEPYYSYLAVFGQTSVQLWAMDADPLKNTQVQVLGNIGCISPYGVSQYSNGDVLFLSHTGIRSLRARDASNSAVLNDVGSPLDAIIATKRALLTSDDVDKIKALVDPLTGRWWLFWGKDVYVLSLYSSTKVSAWSRYALNTAFDHVVLANSRFLARAGDQLYIYGTIPVGSNPFDINAPIGVDASEYDATPVTITTPFYDMGMPATDKIWNGLDVAATGVWEVYYNPEPRAPEAWELISRTTETTYPLQRLPMNAQSTHIALKFVNKSTGPATLSAFGIHYTGGESK